MPSLEIWLRTAPIAPFSGTVYRIASARYRNNLLSMRGSLLHGARYNIRGAFGTLYTSLTPELARLEMARYFTVPPKDGFVEASISLRLNRVLDLTNPALLDAAGIAAAGLIASSYIATREIGLRAWENGIEALLVPSAADPSSHNLAVFLDNQRPTWEVALTGLGAV